MFVLLLGQEEEEGGLACRVAAAAGRGAKGRRGADEESGGEEKHGHRQEEQCEEWECRHQSWRLSEMPMAVNHLRCTPRMSRRSPPNLPRTGYMQSGFHSARRPGRISCTLRQCRRSRCSSPRTQSGRQPAASRLRTLRRCRSSQRRSRRTAGTPTGHHSARWPLRSGRTSRRLQRTLRHTGGTRDGPRPVRFRPRIARMPRWCLASQNQSHSPDSRSGPRVARRPPGTCCTCLMCRRQSMHTDGTLTGHRWSRCRRRRSRSGWRLRARSRRRRRSLPGTTRRRSGRRSARSRSCMTGANLVE